MLQIKYLIFLFSAFAIKVAANFTAAVVEFYPEPDFHLEPEERLQKNIQSFLNILARASEANHNLDIIVFPESALTTNAILRKRTDLLPFTVEIPINGVTLCNDISHTFLTTLACAAVNYGTYIVVNLDERSPCNLNVSKKCSSDGWNLYNTDVVLNRDGIVISKYRKYNLFGEHFMNRTETADISIFKTDFNVTFAIFTCFDILFKTPALDLVNKHDIKYVIYPSMWFSELPFLTALQAQMQWSYATDTVMLSSGLNFPKRGSGGTGIYEGVEGPLIFDMLGNEDSAYFVTTIPKLALTKRKTDDIDKKAKQMDGFYCRSDDLSSYTSQLINLNKTNLEETICYKKFCCDFKISLRHESIESINHYQYHMVAYSGIRSFANIRDGGIEVCAVVACVKNTVDSCGKRFPNYDEISWPVTFNSIKIQAVFDIDDEKFQYPNTLLSNLRPIPVDAVKWENSKKDATIERSFQLIKPQNRLMTFAIYGRDFSKDS